MPKKQSQETRHFLSEIFQQVFECFLWRTKTDPRGGSRTSATSKMERFVIIVNGF